VQYHYKFLQQLKDHAFELPQDGEHTLENTKMTKENFQTLITGGFCTQILHTLARRASAEGKGFYTIGRVVISL
jgi:hypothetical protein